MDGAKKNKKISYRKLFWHDHFFITIYFVG